MTTRLNRLIARVPFLGLTAQAPAALRGPGPDLGLAGLAVQPLGASLLGGTAAPLVGLDGHAAAAQLAIQPAAAPAAPRAEDTSEDDGMKKGKKARKAKADEEEEEEEEDEEDREEMRGTSPVAAARARERARCIAIFTHPHAAANPALAASLASSRTGRHEACAILGAAPATVAAAAAGPGELGAAMAGFTAMRPGADVPPAAQGAAAVAASWDHAMAKAGVLPLPSAPSR